MPVLIRECTQCLQLDQLSTKEHKCEKCMETSSKPAETGKSSQSDKKSGRCQVCKHCQTDLKANGNLCGKCEKHRRKHGKPKTCMLCGLPSAFIGSKCQRCSYCVDTYGSPIPCGQCGKRSAFKHIKAKMNGSYFCWVCCISAQKSLRAKRKLEGEESPSKVTRFCNEGKKKKYMDMVSQPNQKDVRRHLENVVENDSRPNLSEQQKNDGNACITINKDAFDNINSIKATQVIELEEELSSLKMQMLKKDQQLIEKNKQISILKAEHLTMIESLQDKLNRRKEEHVKSMENLKNKNQELC